MGKYRLVLDLQLFNQEKTEKATPKKRNEARQKGQVASSQEVPTAFTLLFVFMSFLMLGGYYRERMFRLFGDAFESGLTVELTSGNMIPLFSQWMTQLLLLVAPIFIIAVVIAFVGSYVQFGFLFTWYPVQPKLSQLNPIQGAKQLMSVRSLFDFAKSVLKLAIIATMVFITLWGQKENVLALAHMEVATIFSYTASMTINLGLQIAALLIVLSLFDYMFQRYQHEKSIKMSKQDIKDEFKKAEGDPLIKRKIREKQQRMAIQRMMQDVPRADVVITNPTHFAVALKYDAAKMDAPVVLAKGMDYIALKIREVAKENGVMTMENKPLARALYDRTEIGDAIPADLFQAVAEVLAYVYKIKGGIRRK